jgi:hypothetical protein
MENMENYQKHVVNKFKRVTLLPLDYNNQITNMLLSGEADIFKTDKYIRIQVSCSLYEVGADVYNVTNNNLGKYQAYLYNNQTNKKLVIGDLIKHGDGFYKLTYTSENLQQLSDYNSIHVAYIKNTNNPIDIIQAGI